MSILFHSRRLFTDVVIKVLAARTIRRRTALCLGGQVNTIWSSPIVIRRWLAATSGNIQLLARRVAFGEPALSIPTRCETFRAKKIGISHRQFRRCLHLSHQ